MTQMSLEREFGTKIVSASAHRKARDGRDPWRIVFQQLYSPYNIRSFSPYLCLGDFEGLMGVVGGKYRPPSNCLTLTVTVHLPCFSNIVN